MPNDGPWAKYAAQPQEDGPWAKYGGGAPANIASESEMAAHPPAPKVNTSSIQHVTKNPSWMGEPLSRTPGSDEGAIREGSDPAVTGLSTIGLAGVPIEAALTRSLTPFIPALRSVIGGAAGHYLGREAGGIFGPKGSQVGGTIGGVAGGLYGAAGGKVPTSRESLAQLLEGGSGTEEPLYVPASKSPGPYRGPNSVPKPVQIEEQPALGSPENPGFHSKLPTRMPRTVGAPKPNQFEGATSSRSVGQSDVPVPSTPGLSRVATTAPTQIEASGLTPVKQIQAPELGSPENPGLHSKIPTRMPRTIAARPEPPAAEGPAPSIGPVVKLPVPREPMPGENPGYMASIPRARLLDLARQGRPGAGQQLQNIGKKPLYVPESYPGPRLEHAGAEPELELVEAHSGPRGNGSGAPGGGGLEEMSRGKSEAANGVKYFRERPGGGRQPLIGMGRQDLKAGAGEKIIRVDANGGETVLDEQPLRQASTRPVRRLPQ